MFSHQDGLLQEQFEKNISLLASLSLSLCGCLYICISMSSFFLLLFPSFFYRVLLVRFTSESFILLFV